MVTKLGLAAFSIMTLMQNTPVTTDTGIISQVKSLSLTTAALIWCWVVWTKLNKVEEERDKVIASKDELLLKLYEKVSEVLASYKAVDEKRTELLEILQQSVKEMNNAVVKMNGTLDRIDNVRLITGGKNG